MGAPVSSTMVAATESPPLTSASPPPYFMVGAQLLPPPALVLLLVPVVTLELEVIPLLELVELPPVPDVVAPEEHPFSATSAAAPRGSIIKQSGRRASLEVIMSPRVTRFCGAPMLAPRPAGIQRATSSLF